MFCLANSLRAIKRFSAMPYIAALRMWPRKAPVKLAIRPHRISLTPHRDRSLISMATNSVQRVTYVGDIVQYDIDIGGPTLRVEVPTASSGHGYQSGDKLLCEWKPEDMLVFGE